MARRVNIKNELPPMNVVELKVGSADNISAFAAVINRVTADAIMANTTPIESATQLGQPVHIIEPIQYNLVILIYQNFLFFVY